MGEDPSVIREQIENTRDRMGETVEALGYKADVPTRAKENIQDKVDTVKSKIGGATPDADQVKGGAKQAVGVAQENPLGLAVGAVAVGFLAGMLITSTRVEDQKLGSLSDEVIDRAKETGQEALDRGKQVAQDAAETAKESGREHADELKSTAQDHAQETASSARS